MAGARWQECSYHSSDWRIIAAAACLALELQRRRDRERWDGTPAALFGECAGRLHETELDAVTQLFRDPISWRVGQTELNNGQHRACALRFGGARRVPVLDESLPLLSDDEIAGT